MIGVLDDILGQAIKASIVKAKGYDLTEERIMKHCVKDLESFMVPKYIESKNTMPKSTSGKTDKPALSDRFTPTNEQITHQMRAIRCPRSTR